MHFYKTYSFHLIYFSYSINHPVVFFILTPLIHSFFRQEKEEEEKSSSRGSFARSAHRNVFPDLNLPVTSMLDEACYNPVCWGSQIGDRDGKGKTNGEEVEKTKIRKNGRGGFSRVGGRMMSKARQREKIRRGRNGKREPK